MDGKRFGCLTLLTLLLAFTLLLFKPVGFKSFQLPSWMISEYGDHVETSERPASIKIKSLGG